MLIKFSVSNYLSFGEEITLDMVPVLAQKEFADTHICRCGENLNLLRGAVIYGANASGKSNLLKALNFFKSFVTGSLRKREFQVDNFKLDRKYAKLPSSFSMEMLVDNDIYILSFKLKNDIIVEENLTLLNNKTNRYVNLYARKESHIKISGLFKEGKNLEDKTRPNTLFLSVCADFNGEISNKIYKWFVLNFRTVFPDKLGKDFSTLGEYLSVEKAKRFIYKIIKAADSQIEELKYTENKEEDAANIFLSDRKELLKAWLRGSGTLTALHREYNHGMAVDGTSVEFNLDSLSRGTNKLLSLVEYLYMASIRNTVLIVDEIDSSIHPIISRAIVKAFMEETSCNTQLIFTTHDTSLLTKELFRRDQIWFTEKNKTGETALYCLADFNVRKDASYGKDYILGKYGAIPFVGNFDFRE